MSRYRYDELQELFSELVVKKAIAKQNGEDTLDIDIQLSAVVQEIDFLEKVLGRLLTDF